LGARSVAEKITSSSPSPSGGTQEDYYYYYPSSMSTASPDISEEVKAQIRPIAKTAPEVNSWTEIMMKQGVFFDKENAETVDKIYEDLRDMSSYDCDQVDVYWDKLLPKVSYLGTAQVTKIYDALRVAYRAHRGQMRKSGEPFIIHPVEVANLLAGLRMDGESIMAGLLHDTVEDTDLTFELVEDMFGKVVRSIVEGETKVSKMPKLAFTDYADEQAENLRQMFVAMTDDYRIIIVKLADRLHNMRTLRHMKPEKQVKISRETLDIFAPLAHRMGIWQFKSELEDTAFMYLYPQEYKRLNRKLLHHQKKYQETLDKSQELLNKRLAEDATLREQAVDVQVSGRTKELYSLWHKMEIKGERNFDNIIDVVALRVIITPKARTAEDAHDTDRGVWLCYHVLGLVQHLPGFQPVPTRVKDYISFPKPNGYQSLHTALILNGQTIEVQIRTNLMHQVAEYGMASHWAYTDGKKRKDVYNTPWLSSIKEWQNDILSARDFVDSVRNELLGKRVFVFLRNGKILNLARGATAIDAAFQIHTEVGLTMHGVEINGKPVPISYELQNGDVVSILTGGGKPTTEWMRFAKSRSTRSKLRAYFRAKQRESLHEAGKILVMDYLWMHGPLIEKESYVEEQVTIPTMVEELAALLPGQTQWDNIDDLFIKIGKQHDRALLHSFVSKLFKVPLKVLLNAEKNRKDLIPSSILDAVRKSQQRARDAARAAASAQKSSLDDDYDGNASIGDGDNVSDSNDGNDDGDDTNNGDDDDDDDEDDDDDDDEENKRRQQYDYRYTHRRSTDANISVDKWPKASSSPFPIETKTTVASSFSDDVIEYADAEHLCEDCLPIFGDEIVGTRPESSPDATPKVHRLGCPHAQLAINRALSENKRPAAVHVKGIEHLQNLMDTLRQIRSVMSVERRFGSRLLA